MRGRSSTRCSPAASHSARCKRRSRSFTARRGNPMRDPNRIDRMIEMLWELWKAQPDMRLGQLLVNVIRPGEPCPRVFYAEDTDTEKKLAKYLAEVAARAPAQPEPEE